MILSRDFAILWTNAYFRIIVDYNNDPVHLLHYMYCHRCFVNFRIVFLQINSCAALSHTIIIHNNT